MAKKTVRAAPVATVAPSKGAWPEQVCVKTRASTASFGRGSFKRLIARVVGNEPRPKGAVTPDFSRRLGRFLHAFALAIALVLIGSLRSAATYTVFNHTIDEPPAAR